MNCIVCRRGDPPAFTKHPIAYIQHLFTPYTKSEKVGLERTDKFMQFGRGMQRFILCTTRRADALAFRVFRRAGDAAPDARVQPRGLPGWPARLDLREASQLVRRIPVER